ncbi:MAG TPA: hypothetical protein VJ783_15475 [Pirellulales bacterium]|nr:hypothetical protein [Pirellulales bacterium]
MEIVFEFVGGIADGMRVASPAHQAAQFYQLTGQGSVGARLRGFSQEVAEQGVTPRLHTYEVVERLNSGGVIHVRAKYLPQATQHPAD